MNAQQTTHIDCNDVTHCEESRQSCTEFGREPGVLDLQILRNTQHLAHCSVKDGSHVRILQVERPFQMLKTRCND